MTDIIDQAIASSVPETAPIETPQEIATEETTPTEASEPEEVPFPKKAVNALSRRDKQIGKLQAQLAADRAELAKYREQQTKSEPKEESFDNYGEYLEAKARVKFEQEQSERAKQQQEQTTSSEREAWLAERESYAIDKARSAINSIPEYRQLLVENADIVQGFPPHIADAFYEAEEPALAFLALAKEGRLDELLKMSPSKAAIEIGKAEIRGEALSKAKQITKAPRPIDSLKGTGSSNKTLESMNSAELLKWMNSK